MADGEENKGPGNAIAKALDATGLPKTIGGKIKRAIIRMVIGSTNPDNFEQLRANASIVEGRNRIDAMVAEEVGRRAIADPEFMDRAKVRLLGEVARKQENIEAIAVLAQAKIDSAPDADEPDSEPEAEPSQDWMNSFTREAEDASSEELRERLAAVLAGEARKPGTYSRATVRLIVELEKEVLEAFQELLKHRLGNSIITESTWNSGEYFAKGILLENAGLISGSAGFTHRKMESDQSGNAFYSGERFALVAHSPEEKKHQVGIWLLTRAGEQVASLLSPTDERVALRRLGKLLETEGYDQIFMGPIANRNGPHFEVLFEETLFPPAKVTSILDGQGFGFR